MKLYKIGLVMAMCAIVVITGCKKSYLDTKPSDQVPLSDAFKTTIGCKAAIQGMNRLMFSVGGDHDQFGEPSIMMMEDLMGNDMPMADRGSRVVCGNIYLYRSQECKCYSWIYLGILLQDYKQC
jgi:hypothetical protein